MILRVHSCREMSSPIMESRKMRQHRRGSQRDTHDMDGDPQCSGITTHAIRIHPIQ